jgi:hypothetical protein
MTTSLIRVMGLAEPSRVSYERLRFERKSWTRSHSLYCVFGFGKRWMLQSVASSVMCVFSENLSSAGLP